MKLPIIFAILTFILLQALSPVQGQTLVYRCGDNVFQDFPCPRKSNQTIRIYHTKIPQWRIDQAKQRHKATVNAVNTLQQWRRNEQIIIRQERENRGDRFPTIVRERVVPSVTGTRRAR